MNFEDFCKNNDTSQAKELEKQLDFNYEDLLNKYKNKSKAELYAEFLQLASTEKAKGNLSKDKLDTIYNTLSKVMNETERENLKNLLNKIS